MRRRRLLAVTMAGVIGALAPRAGAEPETAHEAPVHEPPALAHAYTLSECLALADRNFATLWAARARLALTHAQLDEATWTPWFQWSATSAFGPSPILSGTIMYTQSTQSSLNLNSLQDVPFLQFSVSGSIPLYTFGKLEAAGEAAEANVRVSEWDLEKQRQSMRLDVRRAYYGVQLARDAKYVVDSALGQLDRAIQATKDKLARGAPNVSEVDRLRLEAYRQEIGAQALQAPKGEAYGLGALRFITGVEDGFDLVDEPLARPDRPLVAIVQYLAAARLLRPDVNMARATVAGRTASVDYSRAKLFPDVGLALLAVFQTTPGAPSQRNVWTSDSFNQFFYSAGLGVQWGLDLLPKAARAAQAESQLEESLALQEGSLGTALAEVEKAYADAREARGREAILSDAEHDAKQWVAIVEDQVDLGTVDEGALLEPLRAYGSARVRHLYALMDYNVAMSSLALASGWDAAAPDGR
jgi:outer membrane protein TolC